MTGLAPGCRIVTASQGMIEHVLIRMQQDWVKSHPGAPIDDFMKKAAASEELRKFGRDWTTSRPRERGRHPLSRRSRGPGHQYQRLAEEEPASDVPADWERLEAAFKRAQTEVC